MPNILFLFECKDFYHEEGYGDAQNCSDDVAYNGGETKPVEENQHDYILNKVIWYIGNGEADILPDTHGRGEYQAAVQPVGHNISYDIADVEVQVVPGADKFQNPGKKHSVEGIDTAHNQEHNKGPVEKVMTYFRNHC